MLRRWPVYMPLAQHPEKFAALSGAGCVRPLSVCPHFEDMILSVAGSERDKGWRQPAKQCKGDADQAEPAGEPSQPCDPDHNRR
jgi:hypothetical protein